MMTAEYTVLALREQATNLRKRAEGVIAGAHVEADKLRAAADDLDTDAAEREKALQQETATCPNCQQVLLHDGLGWKHAQPTDCTTYPAPTAGKTVVDPQPEAAQVPEGEGS